MPKTMPFDFKRMAMAGSGRSWRLEVIWNGLGWRPAFTNQVKAKVGKTIIFSFAAFRSVGCDQ